MPKLFVSKPAVHAVYAVRAVHRAVINKQVDAHARLPMGMGRVACAVLATSALWLGVAQAATSSVDRSDAAAGAGGTIQSAAHAAGPVKVAGKVATQASGKSPFDQAFPFEGEPPALHYRVSYVGADGPHTLEVWRDGQSRLRRRTDDALDSYVVRDDQDPGEYQMVVVDYRKRITTRIDRNNLIRLGHFSGWFDLAHGLRHPVGDYRLNASHAPEGAPAPFGACHWYALAQSADTHRICWSDRDRLPLMIWSEHTGLVWRVTTVDRGPIPHDTFEMHDAGFVRNDANSDMEGD